MTNKINISTAHPQYHQIVNHDAQAEKSVAAALIALFAGILIASIALLTPLREEEMVVSIASTAAFSCACIALFQAHTAYRERDKLLHHA